MPFPRVASLAVFGLLLALPAQAQGTAASPGIVPGSAASAPADMSASAGQSTSPGQSTSAGKSAAPTVERSAQSKACSMKADQQGLHGKARKAFRSACKHGRR